MKRLLITLVLPILLSACSSSNSGFSSQDIMFAEMMIPHHQQAIVISDLALRKSTNPEILDLAQRIKNEQSPEIAEMKSWPGVDDESHMGHMMDGMLSDEQIAKLRYSQGAEFDRLFLEGMIAHHEGAITMAKMVDESKNAKVANLAKSIIKTQRAEIEEMKIILS